MPILVVLLLLLPITASAQEYELSQQSTEFKTQGDDRSRAANVRLAASFLDSYELWPGDTFSYNTTIGERSAKRGFQKAHVIIDKKLEDDWGGGACQVATTLYAAALKAGLEIVEHHPHSLASLYIQPGLDATVAWPSLDLRFRNNTQRVIHIRAVAEDVVIAGAKKVTEKGRLTVTLLSDRPSDKKVELTFKPSHRRKRPTWKVETHLVKKGSVVKQGGSDGLDVQRTVKVTDMVTGEVLVNQSRRFHFVPLPRIIWVPKPVPPESR